MQRPNACSAPCNTVRYMGFDWKTFRCVLGVCATHSGCLSGRQSSLCAQAGEVRTSAYCIGPKTVRSLERCVCLSVRVLVICKRRTFFKTNQKVKFINKKQLSIQVWCISLFAIVVRQTKKEIKQNSYLFTCCWMARKSSKKSGHTEGRFRLSV